MFGSLESGPVRRSQQSTADVRYGVDDTSTGADEAPQSILLADDDEQLRRLLTRYLESAGFLVLHAESGVAALEISRRYRHNIHLLITDVEMPEMKGPVLAQKLAETRPATPALLITGSEAEAEATVFPILRKPFTKDELLMEVRRLVQEGHR